MGFVGWGGQPPKKTIGSMLSEGRTYLEIAPWFSIFPGLAIMVMVLFFKAEDGMRDVAVTGVQTCALPIWIDDEHARLTEIPAPSFQEAERAAAVRVLLSAVGLEVSTDKAGNVIGGNFQ